MFLYTHGSVFVYTWFRFRCCCWALCLTTRLSSHSVCWDCTGKCGQQGQDHVCAHIHSFQLSRQQQKQTSQDCHKSCKVFQPKPHEYSYSNAAQLSWPTGCWFSTHLKHSAPSALTGCYLLTQVNTSADCSSQADFSLCSACTAWSKSSACSACICSP